MTTSLKTLSEDGFSNSAWIEFLQKKADKFRPDPEEGIEVSADEGILHTSRIGSIDWDGLDQVDFLVSPLSDEDINAKISRTRQFDASLRYLKDANTRGKFLDGVVHVFYHQDGRFRLSLVTLNYVGTKKEVSNYKRYSFYVDPDRHNKTFRLQMQRTSFQSLETLKKAFSIEAVTDEFYREFDPLFLKLIDQVQGTKDKDLRGDFALLFVIRSIFIAFVQKRGWLGGKKEFLLEFWNEYWQNFYGKDRFYQEWLEPLFLEALNHPPGRKVKYQANDFSQETESILQQAPYLNGELFKAKEAFDRRGIYLPDSAIKDFFDLIFSYNITVEENSSYDQELELNPEFLGIIFERIVNKEQGAIYTPRPEVDMMCRLSLQHWLEKNVELEDPLQLYYLFWPEKGIEEEFQAYQKTGNFSQVEIGRIWKAMDQVTICDPAVGSGAFPVGMMQVIEGVYNDLSKKDECPDELKELSNYDLKKRIIGNCLYGVEVKEWAVWICQLRLWLSLFVDMPEDDDEFRNSLEPLLPNLQFKMRQGDTLLQRIGEKNFPIQGHAELPHGVKQKVTQLKKEKLAFFNNQSSISATQLKGKETQLFKKILETQIEEKQEKVRSIERSEFYRETQYKIEHEEKQPVLSSDASQLEKQKLNNEIRELREQLQNLKDTHPFIWSIEFAEIFSEKGGFDIVIGNPPYLRQESISDPMGNLETADYKQEIFESIRNDFPDFFRKKEKISKRSDLYTLFYVRSLRLMNEQGMHCFICSNSWLDVDYGVWLQKILLSGTNIRYIIDNHARRSFANADVNTIITLMELSGKRKRKDVPPVKFLAFRKPFEEVCITENWKWINEQKELIKEEDIRIYPVSKNSLLEKGMEYENDHERKLGNGTYVGDKWGGKYLRAPDIFFTILEKAEDKLVPLKEVADIRFGIKTGCNEFFYLTKEDAEYWGIEEEFLYPVIKSPKESQSIKINSDKLKYRVFLCNKPKEDLKGTNALKYIEWGEDAEIEIKQGKDKGKVIKGFHNISTVKSRKLWYAIGEWEIPDAILPCGFGNSFRFFLNEDKVLADKRLYHLHGNPNVVKFLNSTIFFLFLELGTSVGLGGGLLDVTVQEFKNVWVINTGLEEMKIPNTQISTIFEEVGIDQESDKSINAQSPEPKPERKAMDDEIFNQIGVTEEEKIELYQGISQLVYDRMTKAKNT